LPVEFLSELENKVETLLLSLEEIKDENIILKKTQEQSEERIAQLKNEIEDLKTKLEKSDAGLEDLKAAHNQSLDLLKSDADAQQEKINTASERIQGLLAKLEAAK